MKWILCILTVFSALAAQGQTYIPLSSVSKYACIQMPDGTIRIGKASDSGYELVSNSQATKNYKKELQDIQNRIRAISELEDDVDDGDIASKKGFLAQVKAAAKFLTHPENIEYTKKKKEQQKVLKRLVAKLNAVDKQRKQESKTLDNCIKKKKLPLGYIGTDFQIFGDSVWAVLAAKEEDVSTTNYYCVRGPGLEGIQSLVFRQDVCTGYESACRSPLKKGYVGIYLGSVQGSGTFTEEDRQAWLGDLTAKYGGAYEVRLRTANKKYELLSCEDVFGNPTN